MNYEDGITNGARFVGGGCQAGHENRTRDKLIRVDTAMPPGCPIKAKLALRPVGYEGIYHLPRCGSYRRLKPTEGFRKALTCRQIPR